MSEIINRLSDFEGQLFGNSLMQYLRKLITFLALVRMSSCVILPALEAFEVKKVLTILTITYVLQSILFMLSTVLLEEREILRVIVHCGYGL